MRPDFAYLGFRRFRERGKITQMRFPARFAGLGIPAALILSVAAAQTTDPAARALLERQQQSDAFSLQLQQSIQRLRAGNLAPRERLELESLQQDQRLRQGDSFYRQQIQQQQTQQTTGPGSALRDAEAMRFEQDRQQDLSRFRWEAERATPADRSADLPPPPVKPGVVTAPIPRSARKSLPQPADTGP
jgi:hypothetical protein